MRRSKGKRRGKEMREWGKRVGKQQERGVERKEGN